MGKKYTSEVKNVKQRAKYRKKNRSVKKKEYMKSNPKSMKIAFNFL